MGTHRLPPLTRDDYMKPESFLSSREVADTASSSSNYGTEFLVIVGIFLLIMLIATTQKSYQDRLKEGHSPTQATAHTASSLMHLLLSIAIPAGLVFLFFPSLHNSSDVWQLLFGGFCCLLLFGGIVSDIFTDVKNRVRPTPQSNRTTPQPASADPSAIYKSDPLVRFVAQLEAVPPTAPQTDAEPSPSPAESPASQETAEASLTESPASQETAEASLTESPAPQVTADAIPAEMPAPQVTAEASPASPLRPSHTSRTRRPPRRDKHR